MLITKDTHGNSICINIKAVLKVIECSDTHCSIHTATDQFSVNLSFLELTAALAKSKQDSDMLDYVKLHVAHNYFRFHERTNAAQILVKEAKRTFFEIKGCLPPKQTANKYANQ